MSWPSITICNLNHVEASGLNSWTDDDTETNWLVNTYLQKQEENESQKEKNVLQMILITICYQIGNLLLTECQCEMRALVGLPV